MFTAVVIATSLTTRAQDIATVAGTGDSRRTVDAGPLRDFAMGQPFGVTFGPDRMLYVAEVANHRVVRVNLVTGQAATVAGNGVAGYDGDGGPALAASLNEPYEIRFDGQQRMYFVEMKNHVVRMVHPKTRVIRTVAGSGVAGYSGDGGPATKARLNRPHSIALDDRGGLLIADIGNHRIRRVDLKSGRIDTIAGDGGKRPPRHGDPVANASVLGPRALAVRGATVFVALREGNSVWSFDLDAPRWKHIAGDGDKGYSGDGGPPRQARLHGPKGIALDERGRILVVDTENQVIRRIDVERDRIETIAGRGPDHRGYAGDGAAATAASLARPHGICVGPDGAVYIGDTENHRVRRVR